MPGNATGVASYLNGPLIWASDKNIGFILEFLRILSIVIACGNRLSNTWIGKFLSVLVRPTNLIFLKVLIDISVALSLC